MPKFNLNWMYMIIALMLLGLWWSNQGGTISKQIPYDEFQQYVREEMCIIDRLIRFLHFLFWKLDREWVCSHSSS